MRTIYVIGATGDVGYGITQALLRAGNRVVAVARHEDRLAWLRERLGSHGRLDTLVGSVGGDAEAAALRDALFRLAGPPDGVATALSSPEWNAPLRLLDTAEPVLIRMFHDNLFAHFNAARAFIPVLTTGGTFVSINGGLADLVMPGRGHMSMAQAAQRALFRALDGEAAERGVNVRVLGLYSMIAGERSRAHAEPDWVTAETVGNRVAALIADPTGNPGAVHAIKSKRYE